MATCQLMMVKNGCDYYFVCPTACYFITLSTAYLPHITLSTHHFFCLLFSKNFNIVSAFLSANRQPDRKKTILAKVGFDAKRVSV